MELNSHRHISTFTVKNRLFFGALSHSLHDALHALIPVAIIGGAVAFLVWFWGNGPTDLMQTLFGVKITNLTVARILSTLIVGFPTVIFAKASFTNFLRVQGDTRAMDRDTDLIWDKIVQDDEVRRLRQSANQGDRK